MAKQKQSASPPQGTMTMPVLNAHAAGIDVGSRFHVLAVGQDKTKDMATFGVTTPDLHQLAQFLQNRGVRTVALESTAYYWIPLFWMLQSYGMEVVVVNPTDIKRIGGGKTDARDARWLQKLHALGLLKASFQLDNFSEGLRTYARRRRTLVADRSRTMNRIHKVLILMNVQIGTQLTDLDGASGTDIIRDIIGGQRDPHQLIRHMRPGIKTPREEMLKALHGTWQPQYLFELGQLWSTYVHLGAQIKACDAQIEQELEAYCQQKGITPPDPDDKPDKDQIKVLRGQNPTSLKVVKTLQKITGVNMLAVGGIGGSFVLDVSAELGFTLDQFPSDKHFTSWLGLAPNRKVSGGRVLSSRTPKRQNHAAAAFRQAANAIGNSKQHPLKPFFLAILKRQGRKGAITATARKLAVIYYHMLKDQAPFQYQTSEEQAEKLRKIRLKKIQQTINELNILPEEIRFAA